MFFILLHVVLRASEMDRECCMQHFASDNALRLYEMYITYKLPGTTDVLFLFPLLFAVNRLQCSACSWPSWRFTPVSVTRGLAGRT